MDMKQLIATVSELQTRLTAAEAAIAELSKPRDRGPASTREMTDEDAFRIKYGDLKDTKHKDVAEKLGLSYGQVFSCRGGYTFKQVTKDWKKPAAQPQPAAQQQ